MAARKVFNRMITILLKNLARSFGKTSSPGNEVLRMLSTYKKTEPAAAVQGSRLETKPYRLHKLDHGPSALVILTKEEASNLYRAMIIIRTMENATGNLYKEREIRGFCHLYSGQEAVAVGVRAALRSHDCVITAYRAHAWTYLMGVPVLNVLAELMGRRSGCARGKGGSMHMYGDNFYGGNGIVGAQVPLGVGIALAAKYNGTDGVCVASYGDGAANQGQIFESFNLAKVWNLPCVFLCENNGYGMGTSAARSSASTSYYKRGDFIPGIWVDGMDVVTVREAARFAIEHCSSGKGPILLECATYRYSGHSMSDPGTSYRTRNEIQDVRRMRDPITSFRKKMIGTNLLTDDEMDVIDGEVEKSMRDVVNRAKLDKEVGLEELTGDIYCCNLECGIRNTDPFKPLPHKNVGATIDQV